MKIYNGIFLLCLNNEKHSSVVKVQVSGTESQWFKSKLGKFFFLPLCPPIIPFFFPFYPNPFHFPFSLLFLTYFTILPFPTIFFCFFLINKFIYLFIIFNSLNFFFLLFFFNFTIIQMFKKRSQNITGSILFIHVHNCPAWVC